MSGEESEAAKQDLWLTYQEYDPAVKQAVRRLGALPGNNVEEFRNLLLASRERKRAKEFEADVVRRLQGEAFVDDEVLQQTLIVLHAENPQLAEQFKQFVAANGRPEDIDLTVARLRSGTDNPVMPERMPRKPREAAPQVIAPEVIAEIPRAPEAPKAAAPPVTPTVAPSVAPPVKPVVTPAVTAAANPVERLRPAASLPASPANDRATDESEDRTSWIKYAAAIAAVLLIGAGGYFALAPKSMEDKPFAATTAPLRQVASEEPANEAPAPPPAGSATPAAEPAQTVAPVAEAGNALPSPPPAADSLQAAPATEQARGDFQPPAREAAAAPPPSASGNGRPVAGSEYKVVRGDRLSVIAQQVYGDASLDPMIQRANPSVRDADLIYSDQMIFLPPKP